MFKRQNRLPGGSRFYGSRFFSTSLFSLKLKDNKLGFNRFGIVVSKKIDKRAVVRNRIKRMLRDVLANLNGKMTQGQDMLFIVKHGIINKTAKQCELETASVLKKGKYIKE